MSLSNVRRAISFFRKSALRLAGLVENMSGFVCEHCPDPIEIFGHGGGEKLSEETGLPLLGKIPLHLGLREGGDSGVPLMVSAPESETGGFLSKLPGG